MDVDVGTLMFDKDESLFDHLSWQNYIKKKKRKKNITNFIKNITTSLFSFSLINKDLKCTTRNLILNDQNKIDGVF